MAVAKSEGGADIWTGGALVEHLRALDGPDAASRVPIRGWFSSATLQVGRSAPIVLHGEMEILFGEVSLGEAGLEGSVILSTLAAGALPVVTGGRLLDAICGEVCLVGSVGGSAPATAAPVPPESVQMSRPTPDVVQRPAGKAVAPSARPVAAPAASGWAAVAAASATVQAAAGDDEEIDADELERGDILLHPVLGRCRVLGLLGGDAVKVQIGGRSESRKLVLRVFRILRQGETREFRLEKREER